MVGINTNQNVQRFHFDYSLGGQPPLFAFTVTPNELNSNRSINLIRHYFEISNLLVSAHAIRENIAPGENQRGGTEVLWHHREREATSVLRDITNIPPVDDGGDDETSALTMVD